MRYADDFVCAFENRDEAEAFMGAEAALRAGVPTASRGGDRDPAE